MKAEGSLSGRKKALKLSTFVQNKKAQDTVILDIRKSSSLCDYFVICSGTSQRQVKAIYEGVRRLSRKAGIEIRSHKNDEGGNWFLVDFFDVILHIFLDEAREFYNLEYLWKAARKVKPAV